MHDIHAWQRRLRPILTPPSLVFGLWAKLRAGLYARRLLPSSKPLVPCVGVGSIGIGAQTQWMVTAWLLGWAASQGLNPAVVARPVEASPPDMPCTVPPSGAAGDFGVEPLLLAGYRPGVPVVLDTNPARAAKSLTEPGGTGLVVLHDHFSSLQARRLADIVLLSARDLDKGWNRPLPAGLWREPASALHRAAAFVLELSPEELVPRLNLAARRLARFGKPVFTVSWRIWRLRQPGTGRTARDLDGEPYVLVCEEAEEAHAVRAAQAFLGAAPRYRLLFSGHHRLSAQDQAAIAADAARLRCAHILVSPRLGLRLDAVAGHTLWICDPEVAFGPDLDSGAAFAQWWPEHWRGLDHAT